MTRTSSIWAGAAASVVMLGVLTGMSYFALNSVRNTTNIAVLDSKIVIIQENSNSDFQEIKRDVQYIRQRVDEIADRK